MTATAVHALRNHVIRLPSLSATRLCPCRGRDAGQIYTPVRPDFLVQTRWRRAPAIRDSRPATCILRGRTHPVDVTFERTVSAAGSAAKRQEHLAVRVAFEAKCFDRIERRGLSSRVETEEHAGGGGKAECHGNGVERNCRRPVHPERQPPRQCKAEGDADG